MVNNVTMIKVNIGQAKAHLSRYIKKVEHGETIVLARRNQPVAEIRPILKKIRRRRPMGLCAGEFVVPADFDAPLPDDLLDLFEGR